jgi:hypothetical protein
MFKLLHVLDAGYLDTKSNKVKVYMTFFSFTFYVFFISDSCGFLIAGKLNLELKRYKEAELFYRDLLMRNPENTMYYAKLQEAQQLTTESEKLNMFSEFQELFPRALAPRRLPLTFAAGGSLVKGFVTSSWAIIKS